MASGMLHDLIDIGANLGHESFEHDLDAVLDRAIAHGVAQMVLTGASRAGSPRALEIARRRPGRLFATAGVHPHHAADYSAEADAELRALQGEPEVVAVGECGLDYHRDFSPRPAQRRAFSMQLQIAADTGKPVFLHQRDAHQDFLALLAEFEGRLGPIVVHCFTGERHELHAYLERGWHIGITGWLCDERPSARDRRRYPRRPADDRDRLPLPDAANPAPQARPPPQRADVPRPYLQRAGSRPRRGPGAHRRSQQRHGAGLLRPGGTTRCRLIDADRPRP
jgi:TatD DNase family protein